MGEQELTRTIANDQQDHSCGPSPSLHRQPSADSSAAPPLSAGGVQSALRPAGALSQKERQSRLREQCEEKLGRDIFQKAFGYLLGARQRDVDERTVKKTLEGIMGRDNFRNFGMSIDQLVFHE